MSRLYPLLRLTPEQAGKLQHDHNRLQTQHAEATANLGALERAVINAYGRDTFRTLRTAARNSLLAQQLKKEIAA